jgi:hypothetical protein
MSATTPADKPDVARALGRIGIALSDDDVTEFRNLLSELRGEPVTASEAREAATALLLFLQTLAISPNPSVEVSDG